MAYIELEKLSKIYNQGKDIEVKALKEIDFSVEKGESLAVMGVSGSGKSTLLHVLGLLDSYESGKYILDGVDIASLSTQEKAHLRNEKIGFVLQEYGLIENETVEFNIRLPLYFSNIKGKEFKAKVKECATKMCIEDLLRRKVKQLSGGQKQRVALARAIIMDPDIILADEPTSALDRKTSDEIMDTFLDLNKQGKTIIMVTHDKYVADKFNKTMYIQDGIIKE